MHGSSEQITTDQRRYFSSLLSQQQFFSTESPRTMAASKVFFKEKVFT